VKMASGNGGHNSPTPNIKVLPQAVIEYLLPEVEIRLCRRWSVQAIDGLLSIRPLAKVADGVL
jgi:hypothetical protein